MNTGGDVFTATSSSSRSSSRKISSTNSNTTAANNSLTNTTALKSSGYASHQVHRLEQPEEELPDQAFSFPMLELREEDDDHHIHLHRLHQLESFRDKFIDMDIALPCAWESMKRSSKSSSSDSQDFDFSRSLRALDPACETPADELFSNGQLLPLQCKLKEEGDDSSPGGEEDEEVQAQEAKADSFSFKSQSGLLPDLESGCVSPDRFPSLPAAGLGDSRSSSFRSSSSYWDSGDKDSGDSSSSCRDSNGSSQDSCFEAQAPSHPPAVSNPEIMNNSKSNNNISEVKEADENASKGSLNWRKSPFKWKVLLGGSKRASLSASSSCSSTSSASSGSRSTGAFKSLTSERRRNHSFTYGASSSGPLLGSFFNGERSRQGQFRHSVSSSSSSSSAGIRSLRMSEHSSSSAPQQRPRSSGGNVNRSSSSSSPSNRVLHKYLKMLRPFSSSSSSAVSNNNNNNTATATATATSVVSLSPPPNSTYSTYTTYMSGERRSEAGVLGPVLHGGNRGGGRTSVEEWRMYYEQREHDKELITCPSFIPGGLRVSSFSSRRSSAHASCVTSSRSSPNHSGVLKPCAAQAADSSSSMADLQSAIQGAIAHCKKSQTTTGGGVRQAINVNSSSSGGGGGGAVVVVAPEPTTNNAAKLVVVTQQLHAAGTLASALADIS